MSERFQNEPVFTEVVEALRVLESSVSDKVKQKASHKAACYMVDGNRLWKVGGNEGIRDRARVECVTRREAVALAKTQHGEAGHWGRDSVKLALMDRIWSPKLDESIMKAITGCPECKNFGSTHLHALLNPITRRHPLELLVGDYLLMSKGKGEYKTIGLYLDTYSQRVWAFKFKVAGSGATTTTSLDSLFGGYLPPETFMTDNGTHFANKEVAALCAKWGTKQHFTPAYSPWVNGLVEGTNKILLHVLKRLCAPKLGEDSEEFMSMNWETLPDKWPEYLDEAVRIINNRILPSVRFSPNELLLGAVVNTRQTPVAEAASVLPIQDVAVQAAYVAQQQLNGYNAFMNHALKRKSAFDRKVLKKGGKEVVFWKGDLVQVYRSDLDYTFKTIKKIIPKWSRPYRIVERDVNSYTLETTGGQLIEGKQFATRRLWEFKPRLGTKLALEQQEIIRLREEEGKSP
ncbi:retrotransposon-like family member (retr-1) partial [Lentinula edodes]|uniref:Retrotransposon-like family member (Retr-1) partial n=1 Tax=Lentinula edodes TaxID=5353 RepID=A0A1Q3DXX0_LENED|nr:retrotransposon-like family member (retr-1) partial [Lentinula edodes]